MKAVVFERFGGPEVLRYTDVAEPEPRPGELLIRTEAIGVNHPDVRERLGVYNRAETKVGGVELPHVSGIAVAGTVVDTGPDTPTAWLGRRVVALVKNGAYAELTRASAALSIVVPDGADLSALAGLAAQATCAYLLLQASTTLRPGESVLVHGAASGVGSLAVQIAKALGAGLVLGTASTPERRAMVSAFGADAAIDYGSDDWTEQVLARTDGRGVDVLIESIGGAVFAQNFDVLAPFGRYLLLGSTRGPGEPLEPRRLMTRSQALIGFYLPVFYDRPDLVTSALKFLLVNLESSAITVGVDAVLPLSAAADAHRRLESRSVRGVIVLDPGA